MQIVVNGEEKIIVPTTILGYLEALSIDPRRVAVELNMDIVPKEVYAVTQLKDGDQIEIVHFVGGG